MILGKLVLTLHHGVATGRRTIIATAAAAGRRGGHLVLPVEPNDGYVHMVLVQLSK